MRGVGALTGRQVAGEAHLRQSVRDILTTPLGSRVMRRTYGSRLFGLIDGAMNDTHVAAIVAASAEALDRWEPRLRVRRIRVTAASGAGHFTLTLDCDVLPEGVPLTVTVVV